MEAELSTAHTALERRRHRGKVQTLDHRSDQQRAWEQVLHHSLSLLIGG